MKQQKESTATIDETPPPVAPLAPRSTDIANALQVLMQAFAKGEIRIQDGVPIIAAASVEPAPPTPAPRRVWSTQQRLAHQKGSPALTRAMQDVPEPKRQRKVRVMPTRRMYSLLPVKSAAMIKELQGLAPAGAAIVVYLADHPKTTAPQLCVQLDLAKKTVDNWLSKLRAKKLVIAEDFVAK